MGKLQLLRNGRGRERWKKWLVKEERNPEGNDLASKSFLKVGSGPGSNAAEMKWGKAMEKHQFFSFFVVMLSSLDLLCLKRFETSSWVS